MTSSPPSSLLHDSDVRRYLTGQLAAEIGSRITREGLPIVAIVAASASAPELAILAALSTLPSLAMGNWAGHWVDKSRRRPVLIGANLARAAVLFAIPLLYALHRLTFLAIAAVTVLAGGAGIVTAVARHAYLPSLVGRTRLEEGNELVGTAESIGETTGPGIMGLLIQWAGGPLSIAFDALSNVASAVLLLTIARPEDRPEAPSETSQTREAPLSLGAVWSRVGRHPILRPLLLNAGATAFFGGFFSTLYELYVLKTLHLSPLALGLLITLGGLGSLVGTRLLRPVRRHVRMGVMIGGSFLLYALLNFAVPAAHGSRWLAFSFLFLAQFGGDLFGTIFDIGATTVEQQVTPDHWLGRVHGTFRALGGGLEVVGALTAGPLALWLSVRSTFWIAAGGFLVSGLFLMAKPLRILDAPAPEFWQGFDAS